MFIRTDIGKTFGVELIQSSEMNAALTLWDNITSGRPPWLDPDDDVRTYNMGKHISDYRARLVCLDLGVALSGSPRADYLQTICNDLIKRLPDKVADAERLGGIAIKWNGSSWDFALPGEFGITKQDGNGNIVGAIFAEYITHGIDHYTRLEYHRFKDGLYLVTNKAFRNRAMQNGQYTLGAEIPLTEVEEWAEMQPEVRIEQLETPLFAFFRLPGSNTIDQTSPLGMSAFANAIPELEALDMALSRKNGEVADSKHITFVGQAAIQYASAHSTKLPRFVQGLGVGVDDKKPITEHVPTMLTDARIKDINFDLSMAGVKCGFSEGVFVMDGQTGMITATQVESDDRDTIQTIKADRDALRCAVEQAIKGADALTTLLGAAPLGEYETTFNFGDITYNYEEDKASWKNYASQGWVPLWLYFTKFEGMSEEEAKKMVAEASAAEKEKGLFDQQ
nr:MAG TPA: portal protein [Caudoviricetes sp.]